MNRCLGCGALKQSEFSKKEGYVRDIQNDYCERCFRINNYSEYIYLDKSNDIYLKKIDKINRTGDLVLLTLDFLNIIDLDSLNISNPIILVFTKKDLLPRSVREEKILSNIQSKLNIKEKIFVSSKNNYNLDLLMKLIYKYKNGKNVYLIGLTSSGKSSLVNKLVKNYSLFDARITVSPLPSTTLDFISCKLNEDVTLIDTPGLLDDGNIIFGLNKEDVKKVIPMRQINPRVYQIKNDQIFIIEKYVRLDIPKNNNIIMYISNDLEVMRFYRATDRLKDLKKYKIYIECNEELVIKGLGFIKFKKKCLFNLYLNEHVKYYLRKSLI